ncbi:DUF4489 domain-containing protein [Clostridium lacusfryxellense]|uniref:DUF4489 domain-containing protein n=1 Tax=Clostridium lacusfryxellense TaxID=205328 RepID=UPI001C0CE4CE|nr:DUF4489 domain-containing protein [Clostridium lacusfryxellense]MBU3114231.1 DUF4489 domain-containing protein [Clostridium lacusfryxellense]
MNSMSKGHYEDEKVCCNKKSKENEVLLKCKAGNPVIVTVGTAVTTNTVGSLILNTEKFSNPCIKFEFASNIVTTLFPGTPVIINFQIFKQCKCDLTPTAFGPVWVYTRLSTLADTFADTFTFFVCDCDCDSNTCKDNCCTYTVVATTPAVGVGVAGGIASINNPVFSATVVERNSHCC